MAPAKADVECVVKSSKRKESEDNGLSSITSSLTCLTLNTDSEKDLAGLEAGFLQICLGEKPVQLEHLEKQVEQEEEKETQVEQKEEEEKQVEQKEKKDVSDEEGERDSEKEEDNEKKIIAVKVLQECKSSEDGKEEEKKEEEKENEVKAVEVESLDKLDLKEKEKEVVPDDEDKTKDKKEYTKEEEVSDSENLSDGDNKNSQPQPKDGKLRSRGFGNAMSQNCMNNEAYHQQHYPQNQEMWSQQHQYPAVSDYSEERRERE
ncbi:cilia- and flagella-associated protein 251-like [Portunus trituberculatus]|uniref:cilia- and flagella-associated protein 251-like n=1 Tax=Portunus trituberculatus TaxID=210409 RepID=UPI001E1CEF58|nr:cilia- and flagella-associated protein 251-like [Portunus trituberculatus]